jgi:hypothetical protein
MAEERANSEPADSSQASQAIAPQSTEAFNQSADSKPKVVSASQLPASSNRTPPEANGTQTGAGDGKKGWFHLWVDTLSKIALIVGAVIGGLWALKGYRETTAPTLEIKTQITSHLEWPDRVQTKDACWAEYAVSLKNDGTTPFDIKSHEVTVWLLDNTKIPTPTTEPIPFVPLLKDDEIIYKKPTPPIGEDLQQHYPPGTQSSSAGVLIFKKPAQGTFVVVMRVDVYGKTADGDPVHDHSWTYDRLCL